MKIAVLLKNGPCTDEAGRAMQMASDMLAQDHTVSLYLLQEAARFYRPGTKCSSSVVLKELIEKGVEVRVLTRDAELRGLKAPSADKEILEGSYESLVDLMESCDQVVGIL